MTTPILAPLATISLSARRLYKQLLTLNAEARPSDATALEPWAVRYADPRGWMVDDTVLASVVTELVDAGLPASVVDSDTGQAVVRVYAVN